MMPANSRSEDVASREIASQSSTAVLLLLLLAAVVIRLVFLFVAPNNTTDAWSRYHYAVLWLQHPGSLPQATSTDAWLPLHFWLMGAVLWLFKTEMAARFLTLTLGALTVLFYWGIVARVFDRRIATASSLVLALFGFHIAFSVTTGSEVPTIFFIAAGTYGWIRYATKERFLWVLFSALMLGAACLCRFEAWLCAPVLGLMLLDSGEGRPSLRYRRAWLRALGFGLLGSAAAVGWLVFSFLKWGDPLELPHRTMWLNQHFRPAVLRHSVGFELLTVPASLAISLSPVILGLACVGLLYGIRKGSPLMRALAVLALVLLAFNYWNSVRFDVTQARYTLLYSWLLIPFAFEALRWLASWRGWLDSRAAFSAVMIFFLLWQVGIVLGAAYAPPTVADRLAVMSPALPLHHEMRGLTDWLLQNRQPSTAVILDDFDWDSPSISRFAHLDQSETFHITPQHYADRALLKRELESFVRSQHPGLLVCSPYGPIGGMWSVEDRPQLEVENLGLHLQLAWHGQHWRVYTITYRE
jgi:4-amino-4-deoxy-L-arabinose transferase-like glycosyltransferase